MEEVKGHKDTMHFVCAADANYGAYAGITLSSVLDANVGEPVHLHLLSDGVNATDITRMARMAHGADAQFSAYDTKRKLEGILKMPRYSAAYYSRTMYSRLFLSELLPMDVSRAIYLDCDVICVSSLRELWTFDQGAGLLAAVRDTWVDKREQYKASLGMPADSTYFNTGVLLINLEAWRRNKVGERLLDILSQREKCDYGDQDIINAALWRETLELPRRWNVGITSPIPGDVEAQLKAAANIHFWGGLKPWHFGYRVLIGTGAESYRKAKAASPWRWKLPDFRLGKLRQKIKQSLIKRGAN